MGLITSLKRDAIYLSRAFKALKRSGAADARSTRTFGDFLESWVDAGPDRAAVIFEGETLTYAQFDARANRYAHWALRQGLGRGSCCALLMGNRPDYLAAWMGLLKIGVRVALINNQLQGGQLAHCVNVSGATTAIVEDELLAQWSSAKGDLDSPVTAWRFGPAGGGEEDVQDLDAALAAASAERPERSARAGLTQDEIGLYIFTSGTTGMPKAAKIKHSRVLLMALGYSGYVDPTADDRMYVPLPLYHATGGCCAVGATLSQGGALILARKFSASRFWDDVVDNGATMFVYVGELCRFLTNAPAHEKERAHKIRRIFGNGLRPDVWPKFRDRFGISDIVEFYAATESPVFMFNVEGEEGSVGRIPWFVKRRFPFKLVKFDPDTEEPVRDANGRLIEAPDGEPGELVGPIRPGDVRASFEGYSDKKASDAKILKDAFKDGDMWFRTGDLLKKDKRNYYYFVDRIGDTFRWKGENVSTQEVAHALSAAPGVEQATVYGVNVPGRDGRAGMAAVVFEGDPDWEGLSAVVTKDLSSFARPLFIRVRGSIAATGTFKERKVDLVKDGFDPRAISDELAYFDADAGRYRPLDPETYDKIVAGEIRV